jgi:hypothetical protein
MVSNAPTTESVPSSRTFADWQSVTMSAGIIASQKRPSPELSLFSAGHSDGAEVPSFDGNAVIDAQP